MIVFNVAGMLQEPPGATREVALRDRYLHIGADVEVAVDAPVRRTCSRCLDPFVETVQLQLAEEFLPTVDPQRGVLLPPPASDEEALAIDARHQIDLTPILHDELALSEPMHPLCRPDCPGLCPVCGRHMDVGSCDCVVDEPDPRLAGLARLLREGRD